LLNPQPVRLEVSPELPLLDEDLQEVKSIPESINKPNNFNVLFMYF